MPALPAEGSEEPAVFPSQVELVTVDAVVVDADGRLRQLIALPVGGPADGEYETTLVVGDRVAGAKDEWKESFEVATMPARVDGSGRATPVDARAAAAETTVGR